MAVPKVPKAVSKLFSEENRISLYLEIEATLADVQAEMGIIPKEVVSEIASAAQFQKIDVPKLRRDTELSGYPIAPLVRQVSDGCSEAAAGFVHWGATTQDIMDTALALQMRDAFEMIEVELKSLIGSLIELADRHRDSIMVGRTFGGHALPITFGSKVARWLISCCRHLERSREIRPRILVGQFGGAVGTLASLGSRGFEVRARLLDRLKLTHPIVTWHVARDSVSEAVCFLGLIMATLGKIASDVSALSTTEIGELAEPASGGRNTSSTLPQKRNPVFSGQIIAAARIVSQYVPLMLNASQHDHERGPQGFVEEEIVPRSFVLTLSSLASTNRVLTGLHVDTRKMRSNLSMSGDEIYAEALMMALAPNVGRLHAHDVVHEVAMAVKADGSKFLEELRKRPELRPHLTDMLVSEATSPEKNLGDGQVEIDRAIAFARSCL